METLEVETSIATTLPGRLAVLRLDNGLEIRVLERPGAGVVSTVLWYRVGSSDEVAGKSGLAHFVEHMMFRGAPRHGAGEIDRITLDLGGDNNAFTSHDSTAYYFRFAAANWRQALALEADRMVALCFDEQHLVRERQVVLEEISMYENEPWEALEAQTLAHFYGSHSYGGPILGDRADVAGFTAADVTGFHRRFCRPANALLTVAGEVTIGAVLEAAADLASVEPAPAPVRKRLTPSQPTELKRVIRRHGEIDRMLLVLPAFPVNDPRHPTLRLLAAVLTLGRASRLHRRLVEERRLCQWISADVAELEMGGHWSLALEAMPGVEPGIIEESVLAEIARLRVEPPTFEEMSRAQRMLVADWLFGHEKVHNLALVVAHEEAFLGRGWSARAIQRIQGARTADLADLVAELGLDPERGAVLGWSLAEEKPPL